MLLVLIMNSQVILLQNQEFTHATHAEELAGSRFHVFATLTLLQATHPHLPVEQTPPTVKYKVLNKHKGKLRPLNALAHVADCSGSFETLLLDLKPLIPTAVII